MSRARANPKYYRPDGGESLWPARRYPSHPHAPDPAWRVTRTRSGAGPLQRSPTRPATPIATGSGSGPFWDSHRSGPAPAPLFQTLLFCHSPPAGSEFPIPIRGGSRPPVLAVPTATYYYCTPTPALGWGSRHRAGPPRRAQPHIAPDRWAGNGNTCRASARAPQFFTHALALAIPFPFPRDARTFISCVRACVAL